MNNPLILSNQHIINTCQSSCNNHVLVVSPSGGGKTVSFLEPNLLYAEDNIVVRVSKRSIVDKYKPYFKKRGYRVYDLNLAHPENINSDSIAYDPLARVKDESTGHLFAEQIINLDDSRGTSADPYWASASTELLKAIQYLVLSEDNEATFADVLDCFADLNITETNSGIQTSLSKRFDWLEKKAPKHEAILAWKSFSSLPYRTAGCVYGSLSSVLQIFTKQFKDSVKSLPTFNIEEFCNQKSVLFVTANATDTSRFKLSNLFFGDLIHNLIEQSEVNGGTLDRKVRLIIDDFGVGGVIESIPEALSFVREAGISMSLLCQSISQLNTSYSAPKATTIKNNCDNIIFIGAPNDLDTANEMALRINKPISEMLILDSNHTLVCRRGHSPVIVNRYKTLEDTRYVDVTNSYNKAPSMSKRHIRSVRKDFSPMRSTLETIQELTNEVTNFTTKLDKRYKELTGEGLSSTKKSSKVTTAA